MSTAISPFDPRWQWRNVPRELMEQRQWVLWRRVLVKGRWTKVPYTIDGRKASSTDPRTWSTFLEVCEAADVIGFCDGIGFVFAAPDSYTGIDLDTVWQSDADEGAEWALGVLEVFSDTYGEESPSETGYKIICLAKLPGTGKSYDIGAGKIEVFDRGRFFALTGVSNGIPAIVDHQADVEALLEDLERMKRAASRASIPVRSNQGHPDHQHHDHDDHHDPRIDLVYQRHYYATQNERHNGLISTAGWWRAIGLGIERIRPMLIAFDQSNCHPPKQDPKELEDILRYVEACPR
jgi:hypothetical protein